MIYLIKIIFKLEINLIQCIRINKKFYFQCKKNIIFDIQKKKKSLLNQKIFDSEKVKQQFVYQKPIIFCSHTHKNQIHHLFLLNTDRKNHYLTMRQLNLKQLPSTIYLTADEELTVLCVFDFQLDQQQRFLELIEHFDFFYCQFNQTNSMIPSDCFTNISQHVPLSMAWNQITSFRHNNLQTIIHNNHQIVAKIQGQDLFEFIHENQEDFPDIFFKKEENQQQSQKTNVKNGQHNVPHNNKIIQKMDFLDQLEQITEIDEKILQSENQQVSQQQVMNNQIQPTRDTQDAQQRIEEKRVQIQSIEEISNNQAQLTRDLLDIQQQIEENQVQTQLLKENQQYKENSSNLTQQSLDSVLKLEDQQFNNQQRQEYTEEKQGQIQSQEQNQQHQMNDPNLDQQTISPIQKQENQDQNNQQELNSPHQIIKEQSIQLISNLKAEEPEINHELLLIKKLILNDDNTSIIKQLTAQASIIDFPSSNRVIVEQEQQSILTNKGMQQEQQLPSHIQIKVQSPTSNRKQDRNQNQYNDFLSSKQQSQLFFSTNNSNMVKKIFLTLKGKKTQFKNYLVSKIFQILRKKNVQQFQKIKKKKKQSYHFKVKNQKNKKLQLKAKINNKKIKNNNDLSERKKQKKKLTCRKRKQALLNVKILVSVKLHIKKQTRRKYKFFLQLELKFINKSYRIIQSKDQLKRKQQKLKLFENTKEQTITYQLIDLITPHPPALTHRRIIKIPNRSEKNCNHLLKNSYNLNNNQKQQQQKTTNKQREIIIIQINLQKKRITMSNSFFQEKPAKFIRRIPSPKAIGNNDKLIVNLDFMKSPLHKKAGSLSTANIATKTLTTSMIGITDENDISVITKKVNGINIQEENTQQHDDYNTKFIEQQLLIGSTILSKDQNENYSKFEPQQPGYRIDQFIPTIFQILQQESNKKLSNRTKIVGIFIPQIFQRFLLTTKKIDPRQTIEDMIINGDKEQLIILLPSQTDEIHLQFFKSFYIYDLYNKVLHKEKITTQERWTPMRLMTEKSYIFQIFADAQEISTLLQSMSSNLLLEIGSAKLCKLSILVDNKNRPQTLSKDIDIKQFDQLQKLKDFNYEYVWK